MDNEEVLKEAIQSLQLSEVNKILATATENYIITNVKLDAIIKTLAIVIAKLDNKIPQDIEDEIRKDFKKEIDQRLNDDYIIRQLYPKGI
jgi:hypothetical protein